MSHSLNSEDHNPYINSLITVRNSVIHGRGVISLGSITGGSILENAPVIPYTTSNLDPCDWDITNILMSKYHGFGNWFEEADVSIMSCGYAMFYNHSDDPNVFIVKNYINLTISFIAVRDINQNEECTIDYNREI